MLEFDMKEDFFWYLDGAHEKIRVIEEKVIGKSRADVVAVLPNLLVGYELKSNTDTYTRLKTQVRDYDKYFDYNYLVVGQTHKKHAIEHVPEHWGAICIPNVGNEIEVLREANFNKKSKLRWQLSLLWRSELLNIQIKNGLYKYEDKSKFFVIKYLIEKVEHDILKQQLCHELFERDYSQYIEE